MIIQKFRGKRTDNEQWVYGRLLDDDVISGEHPYVEIERLDEYSHIGTNSRMSCECKFQSDGFYVIRKTVGQFTGFRDTNGTEIYEGDIVFFEIAGVGRGKEEVVFADGSFAIHNERMGNLSFMEIDGKNYRIIAVIGNIHDKDLLTAKE